MNYIAMLDREFGRFYRIPKKKLEKAYQLALNDLKDPMHAYLAALGLVGELTKGTESGNYSALSKDTIKQISQIFRK